MSYNFLSEDLLSKIAKDSGFLSNAGANFKDGEKLEFVFIAKNNGQDTLVLRDDSGDQYNVSLEDMGKYLTDDEYNALIQNNQVTDTEESKQTVATATNVELSGEAQALDSVDEVGTTEETTETQATTATGDSAQIQQEIDKLEAMRTANQESMTVLKEQIEDLKDKVEDSISLALEKMEEIEEEQKKQAEQIVSEELNRYKNAEGSMTQDEFQNNVSSRLSEINPSMSEALVHLLSADTNMALMSNLLGQLGQKVEIDKSYANQIDTKEQEYEAAKAAEEAAAAAKSCDPIGANFGDVELFDLDGDGEAGQIQIDFFYDEDGDGKINSLSDFVGAEADAAGGDGWSEMANMDGDGESGVADDKITGDELAANNVKVMVTEIDPDGTKSQRAMSIDEFKEQANIKDISIDAQKHDDIQQGVTGPFGFSDNENNQMLGTFDISLIKDENNPDSNISTTGYQTLDDESWLVENYSGNMDLESLGEQGVDVSGVVNQEPSNTAEFEDFLNKYNNEVMPELRGKIDDAYAQLGFGEDTLDLIKEYTEAEAELEGTRIANELAEKEQEAVLAAEEANSNVEEEPDLTDTPVADTPADDDDAAVTDESLGDEQTPTGDEDDLFKEFEDEV